MHSFFPNFVGNDELVARIARDMTSGTMAQGYILSGPKGCGKRTLANLITMAVTCESLHKDNASPIPCMECDACRRTLSGSNPDIFRTVRALGKSTIGIDAARAIRDTIPYAPSATAFKIFIIEEADLLTVEAQNALLLTLESPPPYALFLLLCESPELLLETIRSRVPTLRLSRVQNDLLRSYILKRSAKARTMEHNSPKAFDDILITCQGCIGEALLYIESDSQDSLERSRSIILSILDCFSKKQTEEVLKSLKNLGTDRGLIITHFNQLLSALRDMILYKHVDFPTLTFFTNEETALTYSNANPEGRLLQIIAATEAAIDALNANANVRLTLHVWAMDCGLL